jgi:hypothetical protein
MRREKEGDAVRRRCNEGDGELWLSVELLLWCVDWCGGDWEALVLGALVWVLGIVVVMFGHFFCVCNVLLKGPFGRLQKLG